ncbi:MAG: hypothetical protein OXG23_08500, partial [Chloroflexi bacterium]|nr:hypothetical protein [Chloroflexota bacterium]
MRRNISSELIVALLAAVSLVFAAVFAVLLSTSTSQRPPSQPTVTTVDGPTSTLTADSVSLADATGTAITEEVTSVAIASATPSPTDVPPTATLEEAVTRIAPANLTLTAIRETVVALAARSTARAEERAVSTPVDATGTPLATESASDATETVMSSPTDVLPTATLDGAVTGIAPANLTLTAIRETVIAMAALSTARADATQSPMPSLTVVPPTATLEATATGIAPANLTLTAIRETVVALA